MKGVFGKERCEEEVDEEMGEAEKCSPLLTKVNSWGGDRDGAQSKVDAAARNCRSRTPATEDRWVDGGIRDPELVV